MRQAQAAALVGHSLACPFDLHALLPVPAAILQLGPTDPDALAWLAAHWGVTDRLRQVAVRDNASTGRRLPARPCGDRLRVLHRWRNAARGDRSIARPLAGAAVSCSSRVRRTDRAAWTASDGQRRADDRGRSRDADAGQGEGRGLTASRRSTGSAGRWTICSPWRAPRRSICRKISLAALVDQLAAALRQAPATMPLGQKGDWVVMAAWLVQLRARLLLPADAPAQQAAAAEADEFRARLVASGGRCRRWPAGWSAGRSSGATCLPAASRRSSALRSRPGRRSTWSEFLWASLALFDDETAAADTATVYQARPFELYAVAEARDRILRLLAAAPDGGSLERFLPDPPARPESEAREKLRRRSAWSSTFIAGLELAKQGDVVLGQGGDFEPSMLPRRSFTRWPSAKSRVRRC